MSPTFKPHKIKDTNNNNTHTHTNTQTHIQTDHGQVQNK